MMTVHIERSVAPAMVEFLRWLEVRERTYADTMEAWQTSCPRLAVWEDAQAEGLIEISADRPRAQSIVTLTERGHAVVDDSA